MSELIADHPIAAKLAVKFDVLYVADRPTSQAAVAKRVEACGLTLDGYGAVCGRWGERLYVVVR